MACGAGCDLSDQGFTDAEAGDSSSHHPHCAPALPGYAAFREDQWPSSGTSTLSLILPVLWKGPAPGPKPHQTADSGA